MPRSRHISRRTILGGGALAGAAAAIATVGPAKGNRTWRPIRSGDSVTVNGLRFEAECGTRQEAMHISKSGVVRFSMVPGNFWANDSRDDSERTELDGWRRLLDCRKPMWTSWAMMQENGPRSTADWCILNQMMQVKSSPIILGLKPSYELHWAGVAATDKPNESRVRARARFEPGKWTNFVACCKLDPEGGTGYWRCWMNGRQTLDFSGAMGTPGVAQCYAKFGVYRSIRQTWDGVADIVRHPELVRVRETLVFRFANMRFTHDDLSSLIATPEPIPTWEPWVSAGG